MKTVFLDTSFSVALVTTKDDYHIQAVRLSERLKQDGASIVTTQLIIAEIGSYLSNRLDKRAALLLFDLIDVDPQFEVVPISTELLKKGIELFRQRLDKDWSLVDCISMIVMQERGIVDALTTDHHFRQAEFRALLLED
jgi:predicted nucleic acid-binding protein